MGIITTIPTNLNFPNRGVLERDAFVLAQETAQDLLAGAYTTALNQYATELNSTEEDINLKWEQVQSQAVSGGYSQAYIDATFTPKILNTQTDKATPVDADLIPLSDSDSSFGLKKLSWANAKATFKTYFDTLYLALTGNQSIDGVKTFSTSPIVPTPTTTGNLITMDNIIQKTAVGIGYGAGAGGTVTQLTSKNTAVTINKPTGQIITSNASLAANAVVGFLVNNNLLTTKDLLVVNAAQDVGNYQILSSVNATNGSGIIYIKNNTGVTLSDSLTLNFVIFKGANS